MSANTAVDAVPATAVCEQLARIVDSPRFISSARLCRFLTHIVNRTIRGDLNSLKEFSIAMIEKLCDRTNTVPHGAHPLYRLSTASKGKCIRRKNEKLWDEQQLHNVIYNS
jgi:hypothetical protein